MLWLWLALLLASQEPDPVIKFGTTVVMPDGLRGQIYHIKDSTQWLPNFRKMKPKGTIYTTSLNVPPQSFTLGFPGVTKRFEWFAIDYTGKFWVRYAGIHRFRLLSDDGARLWIDGRLVVDNDGIHAPLEMYGDIELREGLHQVEVGYFQGPRENVALVLNVQPPGGPWRIFNVDDFKPPLGADIPR